jgi:hypothetical protein
MSARRASTWPTRVLLHFFVAALTLLMFTHEAVAQLPLPQPKLPVAPPPLPPLPPVPTLPIPPLNLPLGPPALPTIPSLPQIIPSNAPPPSGSTQLPNTSAQLDAKLLVIAGDGTEPVLGAIQQALQYEGIPYTLYIASKTPGGFTPSMLSDGADHSYYQGVILTTGTLAYNNGGTWTSAFNNTEWQTLWDYQAKYRVRTVIAYAYPTADLGYGPPTGVDATTTPISAQLTATGRSVFPYVNASNPITITKAWTYLAQASGSGTNVLLADANNHALALVKTYTDGRQILSMTFDGNFFLIHSLTLGYGMLNWVTGGLFLGERHIYMAPQVDDIFIDDDVYGGGTYRITGTDWAGVTAWQSQKQLQSTTAGLYLHMAFNGEGTSGILLDTLTPAAQATQSQFPWINHTYSHENLDAASYDLAYQQITQNDDVASSMGFSNFDRRALVTPDVSGLKNPNAMQAAYDAGVRFLVTDTSQPGMDNPSPQDGIYNSFEPAILMVPRRPVNLYYNVGTPTQWTGEYNYIYHAYWGRDLSYTEILDKESDVLLQYLLRGEIDPWMFHQTNLRAYDGVHSLLGDLLDQAVAKYNRIFNLPIESLTHAAIGEWTKGRMQYEGAGVRATISPTDGTMVITATSAAVVPVTGLCTDGSESYGGQCIAHVSVSPGQSNTYSVGVRSLNSTAVADGHSASPQFALNATPNPFGPETAISFTTARSGHVTAKVYDVSGKLVRTLSDETLGSGPHSLRWDGSTEKGSRAAAGIYFLKLSSPDGVAATRLVMLR